MSLIRKIAGTFTFKLLGAVLNFGIVVLITRYLGPAGKGASSLLLANISVLLLFTGILGGTALIYLTPRVNIYQLLVPAYGAAMVICGAGAGTFYLLGLGMGAYCRHLGLLALLLSWSSVNNLLLLGKEQVYRHNILTLLVPVATATSLLLLFWGQRPAFDSYLLALYLSYGLFWLLSSYFVWLLGEPFTLAGLPETVKQLMRYGITGQLANILSFLHHRLGYYLLYFFISVEAVGMYSVGISVSEGLWLVGRSIALVLYARIANSSDERRSAQETMRLARLSFWLTVAALLVLVILPPEYYELVFGPAFGPVRQVIVALSPGIAAVSLGNIMIHFFSGIGQYHYNVKAAAVGLALMVPAAAFLVPTYGLVGTAVATSFSQAAPAAYLVWAFCRHTGLRPWGLLPKRQDLRRLVL